MVTSPFIKPSQKSSIAIPSFYQKKKDSKVLEEEGSEPYSKPHQASSLESGTPMKTLERVTPVSMLPNSAIHPSVKDLEDLLPGLGVNPIQKRTFRVLYTNLIQNSEKVM